MFSFIVSSHELISMRQTNAIPARKSAASGCRVLQCNIQPVHRSGAKKAAARCLWLARIREALASRPVGTARAIRALPAPQERPTCLQL
jgi:hypothetical protein